MGATFGRLEGKVTIPTGGWTGTINDSGAGGAAAFTVAAGTYYLKGSSGLVQAFEDALNVAATTDTVTCSLAAGENGTGLVTTTTSGTCTIAWTSTDLRDILGYTGTLGPGTSFVGTNQCRNLWLAKCPYNAPNSIYPWKGAIVVDGRSTWTSGGDGYHLVGEYLEETWLEWRYIGRARASQANETTTGESFERFLRDAVWGFAAWGTPGGNIRFFPDAAAVNYVEYSVDMPEAFRPELAQEGWVSGLWRCRFDRLVAQSSGSI